MENKFQIYTAYNTARTNILITWIPIQMLLIFLIVIGVGGIFSIFYILPLIFAMYLFKRDISKLNNYYKPYFKGDKKVIREVKK